MMLKQSREWYRARPGYWFRPKLFGWGAVPVTWQGWAATLLLIALGVPIAYLGETRHLLYLGLIVPLIAANLTATEVGQLLPGQDPRGVFAEEADAGKALMLAEPRHFERD